jgi:hypothetical protein
MRLRVYADDALAAVGASASGQLSNNVWVERKTHREQEESVKERFAVPLATVDALIAAGNGRPVTPDELLAHHGQASSGDTGKVEKYRTLATEVAELVSHLQLVRSIVVAEVLLALSVSCVLCPSVRESVRDRKSEWLALAGQPVFASDTNRTVATTLCAATICYYAVLTGVLPASQ